MDIKKWNNILVGEHEMIERTMDVLRKELEQLPDTNYDAFVMQRAIDFLIEFGDGIHNVKEEKVLFPLMVERGIPEEGPIRVMLLEHESERNILRQMFVEVPDLKKASEEVLVRFKQKGIEYLGIRANHIWKENDVLYPMGRQVFSEDDNRLLVDGFERIDNSIYGDTAQQHYSDILEEIERGSGGRKSIIHNLSLDQIDAIMETLPIEITFVDADDTVTYFNRLDKEKIFLRTRSAVGRKVLKCHPEKSVHRVQQIVEGFKTGSLENADFWIDYMGDKVLIRYFPVRDESGTYLGVLEVTQRIGEIQKLSGEKRLLD